MRIDVPMRVVWGMANDEAADLGAAAIEPVHFLLATLRFADDVVPSWLDESKLTEDDRAELRSGRSEMLAHLGEGSERLTTVRRRIRRALPGLAPLPAPSSLHRSAQSRELFAAAEQTVRMAGRRVVTLSVVFDLLTERFAAELADVLPERKVQGRPDDARQGQAAKAEERPERRGSHGSVLTELGRDLTELARAGRLSEIVGRKKEMLDVARILQRTSKRNVLLLGEAGVGKTALVEGLAQRFSAAGAPEVLGRTRIVEVAVSSLVAGTTYRGDMEDRVKRLVDEVVADPNLVLFLDEIHLVVRSGAGSGAMDIANILKPALAREDFRCIGATTSEEYDRYIADESALVRRFQVVRLSEPSADEAVLMCEAWVRRIEAKQGLRFETNAARVAVELCQEYLPAKRLPDKAIDLLENAAAMFKLSSLSLGAGPTEQPAMIGRKELVLALGEQGPLSPEQQGADAAGRLQSALLPHVCGDEVAAAQIAKAITTPRTMSRTRRHRARTLIGLATADAGTFRQVVEGLEEIVFPGSRGHTFITDLGSLRQAHDVAILTGAPPGFVGHDRVSPLIRFLRAHDHGVLAFDNVTGAHEEVQSLVIGALESGQFLDPQGRQLTLDRYVVILGCRQDATAVRTPIGFVGTDTVSRNREPSRTARSILGARWDDVGFDAFVEVGPAPSVER